MHAIVFHRKEMDVLVGRDNETQMNISDFEAVAFVSIPSAGRSHQSFLSMVFHFTNSIDHHWSQNATVTAIKPEARSTSVGDCVWFNDEFYLCDVIGWTMVHRIAGWVAE